LVRNLTISTAQVPLDTDLALRAAEEAAAIEGGWYGWFMLGAFRCRVGRPDDALTAFRTATRQPNWSGGNDLYWFALAVAYARCGDLARSGECYQRGRAPNGRPDSWTDFTGSFRAEAETLLGVNDLPGDATARP
jgi:hypothetical protein